MEREPPPSPQTDDTAALLAEVLERLERQEQTTAAWFEAIGENVAVIYEQLERLLPPREPRAAEPTGAAPTDTGPPIAAPAPSPYLAAEEPPVESEIVAEPPPQIDTSGGFANRAFAAAAMPEVDWEAVIFGRELSADGTIGDARRELLSALAHEDPEAMALAGVLLEIRAAADDRVPQLLKDVGEAVYRWQSSRSDRSDLRDALIVWLERRCDELGSGNRIELVQAGDRYDAARHNARARGVEVAEPRGWVVLRDNGKVYTKANVELR